MVFLRHNETQRQQGTMTMGHNNNTAQQQQQRGTTRTWHNNDSAQQ